MKMVKRRQVKEIFTMSKTMRGQLLSALTLFLAFLMFFPILWMVLTSFKTEQIAFAFPPKFIFTPTLENWRIALIGTDYLSFLGNTLIITGISTIISLIIGIPAAYAMAFYPTKRTDGSMLWVMSTRMLPPVGVIVPLYVLFQWLNLLDTHLGMIIIYTGMNVPLVIWMVRSFMIDIPFEVIEAARMDGVTLWQEITAMIVPLIVPGLAATALLCFIFAWNEFFLTLYIFYNILSQFFHIHELELSDIIVTDMYQLYILVIVIALKKYTNKDLIRLVGISMIVGAVFTSIVSILQFVIDPLFMRIGDYRIAFTPFLRANGSFTNEYFNAYFIIAAFAWSAIVIKKIWFRHTLMALFIVAIFLSFQRMSWIILILVFTFYFFKVLNIRYEVIAFMGLAASIALICIALIFSREIMNSSIVTHRLSEKPDGRLGYWGMVLKNIGKSPYWGYGGTQTKTYYEEMLKVTRSRARAAATEGDLHSGYMTSMFYYGIPSFVFFILFVISNLIYFLKLLPKHRFFIIVFLMALMYMIANLSNTLLFDKYLSMLLAIHMGIGMGAKKNPEILSVFDEEISHVNQKQNSNTDQRIKEQYEFN